MKNETKRLLKDGRHEIIWGTIVFLLLFWTIIGGLVGLVLLISGWNKRMKAREE